MWTACGFLSPALIPYLLSLACDDVRRVLTKVLRHCIAASTLPSLLASLDPIQRGLSPHTTPEIQESNTLGKHTFLVYFSNDYCSLAALAAELSHFLFKCLDCTVHTVALVAWPSPQPTSYQPLLLRHPPAASRCSSVCLVIIIPRRSWEVQQWTNLPVGIESDPLAALLLAPPPGRPPPFGGACFLLRSSSTSARLSLAALLDIVLGPRYSRPPSDPDSTSKTVPHASAPTAPPAGVITRLLPPDESNEDEQSEGYRKPPSAVTLRKPEPRWWELEGERRAGAFPAH